MCSKFGLSTTKISISSTNFGVKNQKFVDEIDEIEKKIFYYYEHWFLLLGTPISFFPISGSDIHGVGPAHCGTCPACALGLDLVRTHVEWRWSL